MPKQRNREILSYILRNIPFYPQNIAQVTAEKFGITRQAVNRYMKKLTQDGLIQPSGKTRNREYKLMVIEKKEYSFPVSTNTEEHIVWQKYIRPLLLSYPKDILDIPKNILDICNYGFTEIFNNVLDHSEGRTVKVTVILSSAYIEMWIGDNGVGIFHKIQNALGLHDQREAVLELTKGKLTTDPEHHTGEGIFFTSRMFDRFLIESDHLSFYHEKLGDDWFIENKDRTEGTTVHMHISIYATHTEEEIFDMYTAKNADHNFSKTHIPLALFKYGGENLVSRSQAKRVLSRFDQFGEICLDFKGITTIGRAFADEIFRVFSKQNPHIEIVCVNLNQEVKKIIAWASQWKKVD